MDPIIALLTSLFLLLSLALGAIEWGVDSRPNFDDRPTWW
jgi:hypothetical protein